MLFLGVTHLRPGQGLASGTCLMLKDQPSWENSCFQITQQKNNHFHGQRSTGWEKTPGAQALLWLNAAWKSHQCPYAGEQGCSFSLPATAPAQPCFGTGQKQRLLCHKTSTGQRLQGRAGHLQRFGHQLPAVYALTTSLLFPMASHGPGCGETESISQSLFIVLNVSNSCNLSHFPTELPWLVLSLVSQQWRCCSLSTFALLSLSPGDFTSAAPGLLRARIN